MERRKSPRLETQKPATLHLLTKPRSSHQVIITDASSRGLQIRLALPLLIDQAVRVELSDMEIFAEVCYCQTNEDGTFSAGLWVHETLSGLHNLRETLESFQSELHPERRQR
jgi:hypothetical protein